MNKLPNLVWTPAWTSVIGCIHGALNFHKIAPDISWLFGAIGHAFIINMSQDGSCPSGPTAWKTSRFYDLGNNIGYQIDGVWGNKREADFQNKQKDGYDDQGYYFSGPGEEQGPSPKAWQELGESEIGMLELYALKPARGKEIEIQVRESLVFALAFNQGSPEWVLPDYFAGQDAYQVWIDALISGRASLMGHAYNAAVWEECRRNGVAFLLEAKKRLNGRMDSTFDQAILSYREVASQLKDVAELYPFFENNRHEPVGENPRSQKAAHHLQAAMTAEVEGQGLLEEIINNLS